jgi:hypothetical protein
MKFGNMALRRRGGEWGPVILPAFKAGDPTLASRMVGSTPTRFRQKRAPCLLAVGTRYVMQAGNPASKAWHGHSRLRTPLPGRLPA